MHELKNLQNRLRIPPRKTWTFALSAKFGIMALVCGSLALSGVTVAQAASYTYVDNVSASENQIFKSGNRSQITGGFAATQLFSADGAQAIVGLETYRPAPGYQTISFNTGGGQVNVSHVASSNASQQCWWSWPWAGGNIGNLDFTCTVRG